MRFHVIALPHTKTTKEYLPCAFTQKVLNFCRMMQSLGHEVYHYGAAGSEAACTEHITCITDEQQLLYFGHPSNWKAGSFFPVEFDARKPYWQTFNGTAIAELRKRLQKKDFICVIGGHAHKPIADAFPNHITVEFGIGYAGTFAKYKVYESYAWMHHLYGKYGVENGEYFDAVIPNYLDPEDFPLSTEKEDYALFVARLIQRKGPHVAIEATREAGMPLKMAGQGVVSASRDVIEAQGFRLTGTEHVEHVGVVDLARRGELMSKARALIMPTQYIGPFEAVAVEAMMCGTPVITTDWGAFTETVLDGLTGYRVRTLGEHVWALKNLHKLLSPEQIRAYAIERYSLDVVKWRYQEYFEQLLTLWEKGWGEVGYTEHKRTRGAFR